MLCTRGTASGRAAAAGSLGSLLGEPYSRCQHDLRLSVTLSCPSMRRGALVLAFAAAGLAALLSTQPALSPVASTLYAWQGLTAGDAFDWSQERPVPLRRCPAPAHLLTLHLRPKLPLHLRPHPGTALAPVSRGGGGGAALAAAAAGRTAADAPTHCAAGVLFCACQGAVCRDAAGGGGRSQRRPAVGLPAGRAAGGAGGRPAPRAALPDGARRVCRGDWAPRGVCQHSQQPRAAGRPPGDSGQHGESVGRRELLGARAAGGLAAAGRAARV